MGVVTDLKTLDRHSHEIEALGYEAMGAYGIDGRRYFRKWTAAGGRTHHLHIFETRSSHVERYLAFRDYLRAHPDVAAAYSDLKRSLVQEDAPTWEGYMDGKHPFISSTEKDAVAWLRRLVSI